MTQSRAFIIREYILITFGSALTGLGLILFLTPAKIAAGGVSGLAVILFHLFSVDPGLMIFVLSIPIFALGIYVFGGRFGIKSLYGTLVLSASVTLFGLVLGELERRLNVSATLEQEPPVPASSNGHGNVEAVVGRA